MKKLIYAGESPYGRYKIVDTTYNGRPARVLYGNRASPQSGVALDDTPELLFDYNQRFLEMVMSHNPSSILVIGGGAFMLPIAAFHQFPGLSIDVVEIDPLLVKLSRDFFDLPNDKRLRVHVEDGAEFVRNAEKRYDMIIIDAFSGYTIPAQLLDIDTIKQYKRHLSRKGVVAINFISEYKTRRYRLAHQLVESFGKVFPNVALYQADPEYPRGMEQNLLLSASAQPVRYDYLHSEELELIEDEPRL